MIHPIKQIEIVSNTNNNTDSKSKSESKSNSHSRSTSTSNPSSQRPFISGKHATHHKHAHHHHHHHHLHQHLEPIPSSHTTHSPLPTTQNRFPSPPPPTEPMRIVLAEATSSTDTTALLLQNLPSHGTICYDASTHYWFIKLPDEWQNSRELLVNSLHESYQHTEWYKEGEKLAQYWYHLVNINATTTSATQHHSSSNHSTTSAAPTVRLISPPSVAALHISLGMYDASSDTLPRQLEENKRVHFRIGPIISFRSVRPTPQNIPGQYTNELNLRYYPTRWVFAEIAFLDFDFVTPYPPHISIACIAVQLNVDRVSRFQTEYKLYRSTTLNTTTMPGAEITTSKAAHRDTLKDEVLTQHDTLKDETEGSSEHTPHIEVLTITALEQQTETAVELQRREETKQQDRDESQRTRTTTRDSSTTRGIGACQQCWRSTQYIQIVCIVALLLVVFLAPLPIVHDLTVSASSTGDLHANTACVSVAGKNSSLDDHLMVSFLCKVMQI